MNFKRAIFNQIRRINTSAVCCKAKDHYNSLGVSPKATQADVKAAYYKLSMIYHPDKTNKIDDVTKFRDITEAYEILGNVKTRKLYDRGLLVNRGISNQPQYEEETMSKFYKSRELRRRPPAPSGRTPIYDFDEWSKNHYGAAFERDMEIRRRQQRYKSTKIMKAEALQMERFFVGVGLAIVFCMLMFGTSESYDEVPYSKEGVGKQSD